MPWLEELHIIILRVVHNVVEGQHSTVSPDEFSVAPVIMKDADCSL